MTKIKSEEPEAYRLGWIPFIHTHIWLDSKPLIPRPETEYWAHELICKFQALSSTPLKVLDLCAGSGAIGVALAQEIPTATVDFVELDEKHHETIRKNIKENGIEENRIRIFGGDLFEQVQDSYDVIFSNPPYIDMNLGRVEDSVLDHEPHLALDGGMHGTAIIARILAAAPSHLKPRGALWLEHEPEQVEWLSIQAGYTASYPDQYGVLRYSIFAAFP